MPRTRKDAEAIFEYGGKRYYYPDVLDAIKKTGVKKGDTIFIHSDISRFGKLASIKDRNKFLSLIVQSLKETAGNKGTIIMPTFTYSFTKNEIYNPRTTSSTVGVLTEYFRKQKDVIRSTDPIFSVAIWGKEKRYFSSNLGKDCFGKHSIFGKMHKKNVRIIFFGASFQSCTFAHYIEQLFNVPYRYYKSFAGMIKLKEKTYRDTYDYFVRPLDRGVNLDLSKFQDYLLKNRLMQKVRLGNGEILGINAGSLIKEGIRTLKKDKYFFLKEKPKDL